MDAEGELHIELQQQQDYRFAARFDNPVIPALITDEGAPLGGDAGPSPAQLLGTAVANCLGSSLLFAMRKFGNEPGPLRLAATVQISRNEQRRLRISNILVELHLGVEAGAVQRLDRILAQFEDFCIVTQSVRAAIPVAVRVLDSRGSLLHASPAQ